jgi:hypothetical protein
MKNFEWIAAHFRLYNFGQVMGTTYCASVMDKTMGYQLGTQGE